MNENTASCSEAFAAALREHKQVKIVGTTTYGKGTVQTLQAFTNGSALKYTTAAWLSPNGASINGVGVTPDIEVYLDDALYLKTFVFKENESYAYDVVSNVVANMQKILKFMGYPMKRTDGYFDGLSEKSLMQFQKEYGLEETGVLDNTTASALNRAVLVKWNTEKLALDSQLQAAIALYK